MGAAVILSSLSATPSLQTRTRKPTTKEIQCCEETWRLILSSDKTSPDPAYRSFYLWFYALCFRSLHDIIKEEREVAQLAPLLHPDALHTIMIFMLKLLSVYFCSSESTTASCFMGLSLQKRGFQQYTRALARSSCYLGVTATDHSSFEKAFLCSIEKAFDAQTALLWKIVFRDVLRTLSPECAEQEALMGTKRSLLMSRGGGRLFREAEVSESEQIAHYAEYAHKFLTGNGSDEENDPNSPTADSMLRSTLTMSPGQGPMHHERPSDTKHSCFVSVWPSKSVTLAYLYTS
jgi:hypothetical protein